MDCRKAISELSCASFQSESVSWWTTFRMTMSFHSHANKTNFHMKGCAPGLALKKRHNTTRKWPIPWWLFATDIFFFSFRRRICIHVRYRCRLKLTANKLTAARFSVSSEALLTTTDIGAFGVCTNGTRVTVVCFST